MSEFYLDFDENSEKQDFYNYTKEENNFQSDENSSKSSFSSNSKIYQNVVSSDKIIAQSHSSSDVRMSIQSITHQQFPEFTHFFICVTRAFNLTGCSLKSLFLKIRVVPSLPIIETNPVWCIDSEVNFRCGYALDFKNYAQTFNLGDYTPVIELYRKIPMGNELNNTELFAFSLLPLSILDVVDCAGSPLTYLMKNKEIDLRQFTTGQIVGYITVTIALGFPEQQQFIDPDKTDNDQKIIKSSNIDLQQKDETNQINDNNNEEEEEKNQSYKRHHRHHHRNKKKNSWVQKAIAFGWKQPGYVDPDWKDKAIEKNWIPPDRNHFSSIGIACKPTECPNLKDIEIQQDEKDIELNKHFLQPQQESSTTTTSNENENENSNLSNDSTLQLFNLINPNIKNNNVNNLAKDDEDSNSALPKKPLLKATNVVTLFDKHQDGISLSNETVSPDIISDHSSDIKILPIKNDMSSSFSFDKNDDIKINIPNEKEENKELNPKLNQSLNAIINNNIKKIRNEIEDSDDNSISDDDLKFNATTIQILKDLNIPLDKLNVDSLSDLSQSSDSNIDLDTKSSSDNEINVTNIPIQNTQKLNFLESDSLLDSDSITNSNSHLNSDSDSNTDTDNFLNMLEKKGPAFTNILNILNDK